MAATVPGCRHPDLGRGGTCSSRSARSGRRVGRPPRLQVRLARCQRVSAQLLPGAKCGFLSTSWRCGVPGPTDSTRRVIERFGAFPAVTGDDLYVDTRFDAHEKAVVATDPSVVKTPADAKSLLSDLASQPSRRRRAIGRQAWTGGRVRNTSVDTAVTVAAIDPRSAIGGRCGGVPRDGTRRTIPLPDVTGVGARREQPIERVTSAVHRSAMPVSLILYRWTACRRQKRCEIYGL